MENYGTCQMCCGTGSIIQLSEDAVLFRRTQEAVECSACNGSGMSGNADDQRYQELRDELDPAYNGKDIC